MHLSKENIQYMEQVLKNHGFNLHSDKSGEITQELIHAHRGFTLKHENLLGQLAVLFPSKASAFYPYMKKCVAELGGPAPDIEYVPSPSRSLKGRGIASRKATQSTAALEGRASMKNRILAMQHPEYEPVEEKQEVELPPSLEMKIAQMEADAMKRAPKAQTDNHELVDVDLEDPSLIPSNESSDEDAPKKKRKGKSVS